MGYLSYLPPLISTIQFGLKKYSEWSPYWSVWLNFTNFSIARRCLWWALGWVWLWVGGAFVPFLARGPRFAVGGGPKALILRDCVVRLSCAGHPVVKHFSPFKTRSKRRTDWTDGLFPSPVQNLGSILNGRSKFTIVQFQIERTRSKKNPSVQYFSFCPPLPITTYKDLQTYEATAQFGRNTDYL